MSYRLHIAKKKQISEIPKFQNCKVYRGKATPEISEIPKKQISEFPKFHYRLKITQTLISEFPKIEETRGFTRHYTFEPLKTLELLWGLHFRVLCYTTMFWAWGVSRVTTCRRLGLEG